MVPLETTLSREERTPAHPPVERIHALDALRATAMFLGIVLHAAMVYAVDLPLQGVPGDVSRHWGFNIALAFIHGFRMHLFFLLSGFFGRLVYERLGPREFAKQRLKRIGLPFLLGMVTIMPMVILLAIWGAVRGGENPGNLQQQEVRFDGIPTMHLWFLNYLLCMYAGAYLLIALGRFTSEKFTRTLDRLFVAIIGSPVRIVIFAPVTTLILWNSKTWGEPPLPIFSVTPEPITFLHYGMFFAVGWWLHRRKEILQELKRFIPSSLIISVPALATMAALLPAQQDLTAPNYLILKFAVGFGSAIYSWAMTFAMIGLFLKFADGARARYFADASYWCYLAHLPIVMLLQIWTAQWRAPAVLKFAFVLVITVAVLLALYEWRVRYTWVGRLLNGPRTKAA